MVQSKTHLRARRTALRVLNEVMTRGARLEVALERFVSENQDRGWIYDLAAGVCRTSICLDADLVFLSHSKPPRGDLRKMLLMALYQIGFQEKTPPQKVVHETVDWIKCDLGESPGRYANAVLRKAVENRNEFSKGGSEPERFGLPLWVWEPLRQEYGVDHTRDFGKASLQRPPLWIRTSELDRRVERFGKAGPVPGSCRIYDEDEFHAQGGLDSTRLVQDISSQRLVHEVSLWMDRQTQAHRGEVRILDLCAAPGGKSLGLAMNGFQVTATDYNPRRLKRLRENVARMGLQSKVQVIDYEEAFLARYDWIWVDAPCSGTGTLRKHPEIRFQRSQKEVDSLIELQDRILDRASAALTAKGSLIYSVCSVLPAEGKDLIAKRSFDRSTFQSWEYWPQEEWAGDGFFGSVFRPRG